MVTCDSVIGVYLSVNANFRGRMSSKEAEEQMLEFQSRNAGCFTRTMRRVSSRSVISGSHRLYRQHHEARELFTCVDAQDVCNWDFNGGLEFDEVQGTNKKNLSAKKVTKRPLKQLLIPFLPSWQVYSAAQKSENATKASAGGRR